MLKANAHYNAKNFDDALAACERALEINAADADVWNLRGSVHQARGEHARAIADYDRVLAINPLHARTFNDRAFSKFLTGDSVGALSDLRRRLELEPRNAQAMVNLAVALTNAGQAAEANVLLDQAAEIEPHNPRIQSLRAKSKLDAAPSDAVHKAELPSKTAAEMLLERGRGRFNHGDLEGAKSDGEECIRLAPNLAEAWLLRGVARFKLGDALGAIADCQQAAQLDPLNADVQCNLGLFQASTGKTRAALIAYTKTIEIKPDHVVALINRANAHNSLGHRREAEADARTAMSISPNWPDAAFTLGVLLFDQHRFEEALAVLDKLILDQPDYIPGYEARISVRRAKGDYSGVAADREKIAALTARK